MYEIKVSKSLRAVNGHIILTTLGDYAHFLIGDEKKIRAELFESNVRDFQGDTEINAEISNTLNTDKETEFWWMNNGVTILSSRATLNGDTVTIENPQIVNGLQTSTQLARHFLSHPGDDKRNLMIKIIASENEETRDKIIKATNSQNAVQPATLRATDKIQRDIEQTLKSHSLFYDRRKNFYKNEGKPADKIISIPLMAQIVMSLILSRPDTARARPSSLIKDKEVYQNLFSEAHPIGMYGTAALIIGKVDQKLKSRSNLTLRDRANLRFYVLYCLCCSIVGKTNLVPSDIAKIDSGSITGEQLDAAIDKVSKIYQKLGATDQVVKGRGLLEELKAELDAEPDAFA